MMLNGEDYDARVIQGKLGEKQILDVLRKAGIKIAEPTDEEDIKDKIDGWMEWDGTTVAVQVKFRESGDDVLFECMKDIDRGITGRDMRCKAEYYLVKDRTGKIRMFLVRELKTKVAGFIDLVLNEHRRNPSVKAWGSVSAPINVKVVFDKCHGNRKLIAYFNPKTLKCLGEWTHD